MIDNWDVMGYYYHDTAIDSETNKEKGFTYTDNSLFFDFELERTYESEAAYTALQAAKAQADADYAKKLAAVKAAYNGKFLSVMGDSISTFNTITNDKALGLGDNPTYSKYTLGGAVYSYERTYWGGLAAGADMDLCVINSWSGSKCFGDKDDLIDNMLTRSYNLSTEAGKAPDVIFLYFSINDMLNSPSSVNGTSESDFTGKLPTGDLYQRLSASDRTKSDKEIVGEWFAEVQQHAADAGYIPDLPSTVKRGETYITWEGAYALALQNIKRLHGNAEVFVFTHLECNHGSSGQPRLDKANTVLRALAEYFGAGVVDQAKSEVNKQNCHMYTRDSHGLHPNGKGHAAITKLIVETLYEKLPK
jgi:lysophospholipase L1-like esterase